ncbi:MAG TPA: TonB-dependent receptor [Acidobacteriaceae bacterium]|nr:TonB-dependent receptor [Acidobacteriaceae bacterium]
MKLYRSAIRAGIVLGTCLFPLVLLCQSNNQAQIRGTVTDSSGAVISGAKVVITDVGTSISQTTTSNARGAYAFTALRASNYKMLIQAASFGDVEKLGIVLAINQQTTLNVQLKPASQQTSVRVEAVPVLLDSDDATLGTDVGSQYLTQVPLENRDPFGIAFLAAGVTETAGSGIQDSYPAGTNFVSNGQRNSTADIRLDGNLTTAPEQGEGGTTNIYYQATVEALQEMKVQNNSFSAEYGNNGGTVIDEVMKSGTNQFHGSAYWFGQRAALDARDFFNSGPKPGHTQNQDGFSFGGPIKKNKTFFFTDLESVIASNPVNIVATVPTAAEIGGDFSHAMTYDVNGNPVLNQIFDPKKINPATYTRPAYSMNKIPVGEIDPVGQAILKLYPKPNAPGDSVSGANNYRDVILSSSNQLQFDVKIDQHFTDKSSLSARYSNVFGSGSTPTVFGDDEFNDGLAYTTLVYNDGIIYSYTPTPNTLWTSTIGLDRVSQPSHTNYPSPTSVGFPSYLEQNSVVRMPSILLPSPWTSIYDQCCVDTQFAHTLVNYSSSFSWTKGQETFKFGGEQGIFYNNFFQPNYPNGYFSFAQDVTAQIPYDTDNGVQGNSFAGLLLGYGDSGGINVTQSVADKSLETAFYIQDDWRATSKLTLNLGLRYEWSTPYTERHNNSQFSDFDGDSGISIAGHSGTLKGTTIFATDQDRRLPVDRNNVAPRFGFAYLANNNLVIRGGAGIYYGLSVATNFQYPGTAFTSSPSAFFTKNGYLTQYATLENPFPGGIEQPQTRKYGKLAEWGLANGNNLGTQTAMNADIYQWNLGIQQAFPANIALGINYSANRSTHLPWGGYNSTSNRNFIASSIRKKYTSEQLAALVNNPFQGLFSGPNAIFNEPESRYGDAQLPLLNLLRPYPQFDGAFEGLPLLEAASWYNALQVVFQKRQGRYLNFEGNYTWSKNMDDSSTGFNAFVGTLDDGNPQELDNLKAEWSLSANDATNRFVAAIVWQLPIGRGYLIGPHMNHALDAVVGGWKVTTLTTYQTGQPLPIYVSNARLADGNQRPNVVCASGTSLTTGISIHSAGKYGLPYLNSNCFADPGDQQAGNAPRYFSNLRTDGIHESDVTLEKLYDFGERIGQLEVHADCFNCTNTPRFGLPDNGYEDSTFGVISSSAGGALPRNMQIGVRYQF